MEATYIVMYAIAGVMLLAMIGGSIFFFNRMARKNNMSLDVEIYLKNGGRHIVKAQITDKMVMYEKGRYIIAPDGVQEKEYLKTDIEKVKDGWKMRVQKSAVVPEYKGRAVRNFITFLEGIELPFILLPSSTLVDSVKFVGAEALDTMFKTKLIKDMKYERPEGMTSGMKTGAIVVAVIVGLIVIGIIGYVVFTKVLNHAPA